MTRERNKSDRRYRFALRCASGSIQVQPFNITEAFKLLQDEDKNYVKMIFKVDDYIARVFFTKRIVVVEGDT